MSCRGMYCLTTSFNTRLAELTTQIQAGEPLQIMVMPSAFTVPDGQNCGHALFKCYSAIETHSLSLDAAQVGRHIKKRKSYGHDMAMNPFGVLWSWQMLGGRLFCHQHWQEQSLRFSLYVTGLIWSLEYLTDAQLHMPSQTHQETSHDDILLISDLHFEESETFVHRVVILCGLQRVCSIASWPYQSNLFCLVKSFFLMMNLKPKFFNSTSAVNHCCKQEKISNNQPPVDYSTFLICTPQQWGFVMCSLPVKFTEWIQPHM